MDGYTIKAVVAIGALILLLLLWLVWKFFYRLFKHVIIALLIGAVGAAIYYYRDTPTLALLAKWLGIPFERIVDSPPPPRDQNLGKHAYGLNSGRYLGVVEGQGEDKQRGPIWIIRPPGGYPTMYPKTRVTLKDKWEPEAKAADSPTPAPSPASAKDGARKKK